MFVGYIANSPYILAFFLTSFHPLKRKVKFVFSHEVLSQVYFSHQILSCLLLGKQLNKQTGTSLSKVPDWQFFLNPFVCANIIMFTEVHWDLDCVDSSCCSYYTH